MVCLSNLAQDTIIPLSRPNAGLSRTHRAVIRIRDRTELELTTILLMQKLFNQNASFVPTGAAYFFRGTVFPDPW